MSSTLCFRKTPQPPKEFGCCRFPLKGVFAEAYYGHDGSLGGGVITIEIQDLAWIRGVRDGGGWGKDDKRLLDTIVETLESGRTVDMWFEV